MIVEFSFDVSTLQSALTESPGMTVEMDHMTSTDTVALRKFFWARGGNFEAFESGLEDDPTVRDPKRITEAPDSRYYRVIYPDHLPGVDAYRAVVELDGMVLDARTDGDGWTGRIRYPDRDALNEWCERCEGAGITVDIEAIYDQERQPPEHSYGLTPGQREALVTAAESGYFSIPRETSLAGVGEELGVSSQSASERLRRGMITLIENTLDED
ncbi:helix-turn-helix domain-containing protein [Natranaeroarchaeum sulfidigenes]|uniref:Transcriptional regulator, contains HTH domain n=1 Tax=Natranaeroarchaeum sulfidigenes TaxID=2784880 RepID=A0A897MZ68_9EURY|nr:helix-turn-helix domain-containing protein [Natranaeroarchaeum sulfidigenes]QSG03665.1 Transcriptional regulator, contains HTH domain [Natranaeroarchaeum sulfidigenes]